jgi:hypothetical protein
MGLNHQNKPSGVLQFFVGHENTRDVNILPRSCFLGQFLKTEKHIMQVDPAILILDVSHEANFFNIPLNPPSKGDFIIGIPCLRGVRGVLIFSK